MSGRVSKLARHRRPSVARRAAPSRTLSSHHLIPSCSAAYPHHRRHLSKRAVFGSSFDAHAVIAPPRRTPGKNALRRPRIMAIITTPRPSTSATRRKTGREDSVLALLVSSLIVPRIRRRRIPPAVLSIPRRRQFPGHYSAPFSSAHHIRPVSSSHRLIHSASSIQQPAIKSGQASKARQRAPLSPVIVFTPRLVIASPRLTPRVGLRGERRLVPIGHSPFHPSRNEASFLFC